MSSTLPDRAAVEADLSESQLQALREVCESLLIPLERWPRVPTLRTWAVLAAASRRVRQMEREEGHSQTQAILTTAVRYGMSEKTLGAALRRANKAGLKGRNCAEESPANCSRESTPDRGRLKAS